MSMHSPKKPKEPKDAKELRARQLIDLADLDEEENRRIKALFRGRQGGRVFRSPTAARTASNTAGNASAAAPSPAAGMGRAAGSLIPASGFLGARGSSRSSGAKV